MIHTDVGRHLPVSCSQVDRPSGTPSAPGLPSCQCLVHSTSPAAAPTQRAAAAGSASGAGLTIRSVLTSKVVHEDWQSLASFRPSCCASHQVAKSLSRSGLVCRPIAHSSQEARCSFDQTEQPAAPACRSPRLCARQLAHDWVPLYRPTAYIGGCSATGDAYVTMFIVALEEASAAHGRCADDHERRSVCAAHCPHDAACGHR
jgi:hypothetical protein